MENEEFDVDALNAGLNDLPVEEPEENEEATEVEAHEEESEELEEHQEGHEETHAQQSEKSRKEQRLQKLANERAAEREQRLLAEQEAKLLRQQLEEMRRGQQIPREEENLDPLEKWQRDANKTLMQVQMRQADLEDRSRFIEQVSKNPAEAAYIDRVEQELAIARKNGFNPTREQVLIILMGKETREKLRKAPDLKREAAARVKTAAGKPLGTKSNVASTKTESTEFDRLKGIPL